SIQQRGPVGIAGRGHKEPGALSTHKESNVSEPTTVVQESFDTAIECIQDSLIRDAQMVERLESKGKRANAAMIANIREDARKKIESMNWIMTQTGWVKTDRFSDRSHHWETFTVTA